MQRKRKRKGKRISTPEMKGEVSLSGYRMVSLALAYRAGVLV